MSEYALYVITRGGLAQAARLLEQLPDATLFVSERLLDEAPDGAHCLSFPLPELMRTEFHQHRIHLCFFSTGIVLRAIAPLLEDKRTDPAVLAIDEAGQHVIPLLGGHRGGANACALRIAHLLGAQPVLTTASDVSGTLAVDLLGAEFGWRIDPHSEANITAVAGALVNREPVLVVQECGEPGWWHNKHPLPDTVRCCRTLADVDLDDWAGIILISDRADALHTPELAGRCVLLRPRTLVAGVGCDRDTSLATLQQGLEQLLASHNLSPLSLKSLASIDLKADEPGLLKLAAQQALPIRFYPAAELDQVQGIESPSATVKRLVGVSSVAEAAALKQSGCSKLLLPKQKYAAAGKNMTLALCRLEFAEPLQLRQKKRYLGEPEPCATRHPHCKPARPDPEKPILFYRHQLLLCCGGRCVKQTGKSLAHRLRREVKALGLDRGPNRIKVSRSLCLGACRFSGVAVIYAQNSNDPNSAVWLRGIEQFSLERWQQLFQTLSAGQRLSEVLPAEAFLPIAERPQLEPQLTEEAPMPV